MLPLTKPAVKICCIQTLEEAKLAIKFGASAIGLVSEMPSGPGVISEEKIVQIAKSTPPNIETFLLTCKRKAEEIIDQHNRCGTTIIQLVDAVDNKEYQKLRNSLPKIKIIQVIHVSNFQSIKEAKLVVNNVDGLLLDSGNPDLKIKELGGTGRTHNWDLSKQIRELVDIPVYLAGGLNPQNIRDAITQVAPFGVDICSGVRTKGKLDADKLQLFFNQISLAE